MVGIEASLVEIVHVKHYFNGPIRLYVPVPFVAKTGSRPDLSLQAQSLGAPCVIDQALDHRITIATLQPSGELSAAGDNYISSIVDRLRRCAHGSLGLSAPVRRPELGLGHVVTIKRPLDC
jgi:hypothetical protein